MPRALGGLVTSNSPGLTTFIPKLSPVYGAHGQSFRAKTWAKCSAVALEQCNVYFSNINTNENSVPFCKTGKRPTSFAEHYGSLCIKFWKWEPFSFPLADIFYLPQNCLTLRHLKQSANRGESFTIQCITHSILTWIYRKIYVASISLFVFNRTSS